MKRLPELYKNTNIRAKNNNKEVDYIKKQQKEEIIEKINSIFQTLGYPYNIPVKIMTKEKTYYTSLVTKNKKIVLTIDDDKILIKDIIDIIRL